MWKKGLLAGIAILISGLAINWLVGNILPNLMLEYQNTDIFRSWDDPLMLAYFAYPFILGVAAAYLWSLVESKLKGRGYEKALEFAKLYFIIATIPGMYISYTSFQLSLAMILLWAITGFIQVLIAGLVFIKVK